MSVGVVLLDLNQSETTLRCLHSVVEGCVSPEVVVLVENGENRVSREELNALEETTEIVILRPGRNLGCAGGRNLGLNYLSTNTDISTYLILDNDTVVPKEFIGDIEERTFDDGEVIAPVIEDLNKDTIWSSGGTVEADGSIEQLTASPESNSSPFTVDWAPGACLITKQETWRKVGGFDEWMNFFFADIEWCLRLGEIGGKVTIHPDLRIEHEGHLTLGGEQSPTRTRLWARNGTVFRTDALGTGPIVTMGWLFRELQTGLSELVKGQFSYSTARVTGLVEGVHESVQRHRAD